MSSSTRCPRCGGELLWNGHGMSCIACSYFLVHETPPSEKKIALPRKKSPNDGRK